MRNRINHFFDIVELVARRMPSVGRLIVEVFLVLLIAVGVVALFKSNA